LEQSNLKSIQIIKKEKRNAITIQRRKEIDAKKFSEAFYPHGKSKQE